MKRKICMMLLSIALVGTLALNGCGSSSASTESTDEQEETTAEDEETEEEDTSEEEESSETDDILESAADEAEVSEKNFEDVQSTSEFLELGEYKGLTLELSEDAEIASGNIATIDYVGSVDGVEFDGGSAEDYDLTIGSGTFIDDFEDQLIGHKKGDEVLVEVTFPDDYQSEDLAGKDAEFKVTIKAIKEKSTADVFDDVVADSKVLAYPKDLYDAWVETARALNENYAEQYGMSYEDFLESQGQSEESMDNIMRNMVKYQLVAKAIMEAENIAFDGEEYENRKQEVFDAYGVEGAEELEEQGMSAVQLDTNICCSLAYKVIEQYQE